MLTMALAREMPERLKHSQLILHYIAMTTIIAVFLRQRVVYFMCFN